MNGIPNFATLILAAALALHPITVRIASHAVGMRGTQCITVTVERAEVNRGADLVTDNQRSFYRSTYFQLDGLAARRTQPRQCYDNLPSGEYVVIATLYGSGRKILSVARDRFTVIGEPDPTF